MINLSRSNDQHGSRIGKKPTVARAAQQSLVARGRTKMSRPKSRYEELKDTIRIWLEDRFAIASALKEIRDDKLYKKEYDRFEDFCHDEYGMSRAYAYQLIEAAGVSTDQTPISNVSQARALAKVAKEKRVEVLETVARSGPVTTKRIREAAAPKVIDVEPEPQRVHGCPMCRC